MSNSREKPAKRKRSILKGALAGLVGGIAGSGAKLVAEALVPRRLPGQTPVIFAERIAGHPLDPAERRLAVQGGNWILGALAGAAYGALAEVRPRTAAWRGIAFGLTLNRLTHQGLLPKVGLSAPGARQPMQERASGWVTHAVYGVVTDTVRRGIRAGLD